MPGASKKQSTAEGATVRTTVTSNDARAAPPDEPGDSADAQLRAMGWSFREKDGVLVSVADGEPYTVERFTGEWESLAAAISDFVVAACDVPFDKWDITTISPRSRRQGTPEVRSGIWSSSERVF